MTRVQAWVAARTLDLGGGPFGELVEWLARLLCDVRFLDLSPYGDAASSGSGVSSSTAFVKWALRDSGEGLSREVESRSEIGWHHMGNALLSASRRGGFVVKGDLLCHPSLFPHSAVPKYSFPGNEVGGILAQRGKRLAVKAPAPRAHLERGIFVGAMAPHNWFHWTIDTIPTVWALQQLPDLYADYPLLLPQIETSKSSWIEALELVRNDRKVFWCEPDEFFSVEDLVVFDGLTACHPRVHGTSVSPRVSLRQEEMRAYRSEILNRLRIRSRVVRGKRYFLARRPSDARNYNQEEVWKVLQQFDFKLVFLDDLTYAESIQLFASAEVLAGPHGAGWAGLLFSPQETQCVFWGWRDTRGDNWYENLAGLAGVGWSHILVQTAERRDVSRKGDPRQESYYCDPREIETALERILLPGPPNTASAR